MRRTQAGPRSGGSDKQQSWIQSPDERERFYYSRSALRGYEGCRKHHHIAIPGQGNAGYCLVAVERERVSEEIERIAIFRAVGDNPIRCTRRNRFATKATAPGPVAETLHERRACAVCVVHGKALIVLPSFHTHRQ